MDETCISSFDGHPSFTAQYHSHLHSCLIPFSSMKLALPLSMLNIILIILISTLALNHSHRWNLHCLFHCSNHSPLLPKIILINSNSMAWSIITIANDHNFCHHLFHDFLLLWTKLSENCHQCIRSILSFSSCYLDPNYIYPLQALFHLVSWNWPSAVRCLLAVQLETFSQTWMHKVLSRESGHVIQQCTSQSV